MGNQFYVMPAKVWEHSVWVNEVDGVKLVKDLSQLLQAAGFNILNYVGHEFKPQGCTALWLLSESHLALHTFPEQGKSYIQLSSCMLPHFQKFITFLNEKYK